MLTFLVILMGDSPGDRHMAEGLPTDCILKIGLLNVNCSQERLLEFCNYFDIIAIQDNTMNFLFNLLEEINSAPVVNST